MLQFKLPVDFRSALDKLERLEISGFLFWSEAMKEIPLTQGKVALVDDEDYEWLMQWRWFAKLGGDTWYACRNEGIRGQAKTIRMHREIVRAVDGEMVDHKNGNGLDNRRKNLRKCSNSENCMNRRIQKNNSGYKGVFYDKRRNQYLAHIKKNGKMVYLGYFATAREAASVYDKAAVEHFGEFARLNSPTS